MPSRKEWNPRKSAFIIVGRIPFQDNVMFEVLAFDEEEALKKFSDALWEGRLDERAKFEEEEGGAYYTECVIQVQGRYRVLSDPEGGGTEKWTSTE